MAATVNLIIGAVASVILVLLLAWRELTSARGRPVARFVQVLTFASAVVFIASLTLRLTQLLGG